MDLHEKRISQAMGHDESRPVVSFFDHAMLDQELSKKSGRPRYKPAVYIRKIPSAPDLVVRDVFDTKATEEHKREYPEEWARYLERKQKIDNLDPPVAVIPGINVAAIKELNAIGIQSCADFVGYEGELEGLEGLRHTAKRILEVSDEIRGQVPEKREDVRNEADRHQNRPASVHWGSESHPKEEGEIFNYTFKVSA